MVNIQEGILCTSGENINIDVFFEDTLLLEGLKTYMQLTDWKLSAENLFNKYLNELEKKFEVSFFIWK